MLVGTPPRPWPISMATAISISSLVITTATPSSSETQVLRPLPLTSNKARTLPSEFRMLVGTPPRPWPISMATAISISSLVITTATPSSSETQVLRPLPLTSNKARTLPSELKILATSPPRPWPISTMTAISISSSVITTATPTSFATPPLQAQQLPPTPQLKAQLPSGLRMLATSPARPWPIPIATEILISSLATKTATPTSFATPPLQAQQLPPTPQLKPIPSKLQMLDSTQALPLPMSMPTAILISSLAIPQARSSSSATPRPHP